MTEFASSSPLVLRGRRIAEDASGRICLDDIHSLLPAPRGTSPALWRLGQTATSLINALGKRLGLGVKADSQIIYVDPISGQRRTYAHPILAAAYAGHLSPDLEIEVREVWLRYRAGDATLADEILQRASKEANEWTGRRALARARRNNFTDVLKDHGVEKKGYMHCTEAVYLNLLGGESYKLRKALGLAKNANLRDALGVDDLTWIMAAEVLSAERISEEGSQGNAECARASALSAASIRMAVESDRRSRQPRLR